MLPPASFTNKGQGVKTHKVLPHKRPVQTLCFITLKIIKILDKKPNMPCFLERTMWVEGILSERMTKFCRFNGRFQSHL